VTSETLSSVNAFFDSYRAAFERFDAHAVADHFAFPGHVTGDMGEITLIPVATKQDWLAQIERIIGMYKTIGVSTARVLELKMTEISPRLVQAVIHWELQNGAGAILYDFDAIYTLAKVGDDLRVSAIAHNEIPRYKACVARLQAQRTADGG
jgi:hypothetical protein